uniref:Uncharacterized protein n=1 Tax=Sipha flava TaxID=143950 RepID=A0A2S2Q8T3_9HEMI
MKKWLFVSKCIDLKNQYNYYECTIECSIPNKITCSVILSDDGLLTISDCGHRSYLEWRLISDYFYTRTLYVYFNNCIHKYNMVKKPDLRVTVSSIKSNMETVVSKIQAQVYH